MSYDGPPLQRGQWGMELVPQPDGWTGLVYTSVAEPPRALLVLDDDQVMDLDIDPRPLEWLLERGNVRRV
jgi:hypothetical protein